MKGFRKSGAMLRFGLFFCGVLCFADAHAAIPLNDTFDIPAGTSTRANDALDPQDAAWYAIAGTATYLHTANDGVTGSRAMMIEGSTVWALANFSEVTLASAGDYIQVSIEWRTDREYTLPQYAEYYIAYGLYGSNGTVVTADGQASTTYNDRGYYVLQQLDGYMAIKQEIPATAPILGGAASDYLDYGSTGVGNLGDGAQHTTALLLTRVAGGLEAKVYYDGSLAMTGVDTSAIVNYTFNEVVLRAYMHGDTYVDNIRIEATGAPTTCAEAIARGFGMAMDIDQNCIVDFADLAMLLGEWLDCVDPEVVGCSQPWNE